MGGGMLSQQDFDDAMAELVNVGVGRAAASLSSMVKERIDLSVPRMMTVRLEDLHTRLDMEDETFLSLVQQSFTGRMSGSASVLFPIESARRLVSLLTEDELSEEEVDLECEAALTEVGNILINGVMGTIGNMTGLQVQYQIPEYFECSSTSLGDSIRSQEILLAVVVISISGNEIKGHLILLFDLPSVETLSLAIERLSI
jgi:chemotaxis protein CheC